MVGEKSRAEQRQNFDYVSTRRLFCLERKICGAWKQLEIKHYLNVLELRATKYAIRTFPHLDPTVWSILVQSNEQFKE